MDGGKDMRSGDRARNRAPGRELNAEEARQGRIVLSSPGRRRVFILGLAVLVLFPLLLLLLS